MTPDPKAWYLSKTVWGGLLALLSTFIKNTYHVDLTDEIGAITSYTLATVQFAGVIIAIAGRFQATQPLKPITLGRTPPPAKGPLLPLILAWIGVAYALSLSTVTI